MLETFNQMAKITIPEPYGTILKTLLLLIIGTIIILEIRRAYLEGYDNPFTWINKNRERAFMWFGLLMLLFTLFYVSTPQVVFDTSANFTLKDYKGDIVVTNNNTFSTISTAFKPVNANSS